MLTKFPASNACAAIFKNTDSSYSSVKVTELSKFNYLFLFKSLYIFIVNGSTILFSKHGKNKRWKGEVGQTF